jgi:hypothetical protein
VRLLWSHTRTEADYIYYDVVILFFGVELVKNTRDYPPTNLEYNNETRTITGIFNKVGNINIFYIIDIELVTFYN